MRAAVFALTVSIVLLVGCSRNATVDDDAYTLYHTELKQLSVRLEGWTNKPKDRFYEEQATLAWQQFEKRFGSLKTPDGTAYSFLIGYLHADSCYRDLQMGDTKFVNSAKETLVLLKQELEKGTDRVHFRRK